MKQPLKFFTIVGPILSTTVVRRSPLAIGYGCCLFVTNLQGPSRRRQLRFACSRSVPSDEVCFHDRELGRTACLFQNRQNPPTKGHHSTTVISGYGWSSRPLPFEGGGDGLEGLSAAVDRSSSQRCCPFSSILPTACSHRWTIGYFCNDYSWPRAKRLALS
ncbi:hypothetical protein L6452_27157 [Arctium lappa]|uniref:Uncharacterized protein n=1 Tax=Arctium lappa TaxID=4217 RepID=A0ACB8ZUY8_ARCLA|nr:hypothetical protein L6452_27157 [Arctium lappa]